MNRLEALHILGLGEDATSEDVKTAYRECAQILHPDKFATNKKLQERATEQFKNLREAYDYLVANEKSRQRRTGSSSGSGRAAAQAGSNSAASSHASAGVYDDVPRTRREAEARLAGIAAARAQLIAQRDVAEDERRNGLIMIALGAVIAFFTIRRPFGLLGLVAAAASTACVWGVVQTASALKTMNTLNDHLRKLNAEKQKLTAELESL